MKITKKGQEMSKIWSMFGDGPMFDDGHIYPNSWIKTILLLIWAPTYTIIMTIFKERNNC
jgi:hypothetical protein